MIKQFGIVKVVISFDCGQQTFKEVEDFIDYRIRSCLEFGYKNGVIALDDIGIFKWKTIKII